MCEEQTAHSYSNILDHVSCSSFFNFSWAYYVNISFEAHRACLYIAYFLKTFYWSNYKTVLNTLL